MTSLRVLLADDHAPTLEELRDALQDDPRFTVVAAVGHAAAAVSDAVQTRPDLCLLDIEMPGNGIAACWEITARLPQTIVVMFTVSAADNDLFAALRAGASGYLLKDTDPARIPELLVGATTGHAAIPPTLVARMVRHFRHRRPPTPPTRRSGPADQPRMGGARADEPGADQHQIARELSVSPVTVRSHVAAVLRKLRVPDRDAAVRMFADQCP